MFQISDFRLYNVNEIFFVDTFITCSTGKMKYFIFILFTNLDGIFKKYLIKVSHFRVHVEEHVHTHIFVIQSDLNYLNGTNY